MSASGTEWHLFLDDERMPGDVTWVELPDVPWTIVRDFRAFVQAVLQRGIPATVSFDHDLAWEHYQALATGQLELAGYDQFAELTGYHCAKWLVEHCLQRGLRLPAAVFIHTMNPIGRDRIHAILEQGRRHGA